MSKDKLDLIREACPSVLPSLLQCDFGDLRSEVEKLQAAGTRILHLDVMDGHFVENLTYGMPIVKGLRKHTDMLLDVHLMISDPLAYAREMVDCGADLLTFHVEAVEDPAAVAKAIRALGVPVGVALNPQTPLEQLDPCLDQVDMVLVMSVEAGRGGQMFDPAALGKLSTLKENRPELLLEVDGGVNLDTVALCREVGCDLFVVGSAIFRHDDYREPIKSLESAIEGVTT